MQGTAAGLWVGVDWGDESHTVCALSEVDVASRIFCVPHTPEGLEEVATRLRGLGQVKGIAVEATKGPLIYGLLDEGFTVFPINPKLSCAWRGGRSAAEAKDDEGDSITLADGLRQHHRRLQPLEPDDEKTRELALLCRDECRLIRHRTALTLTLKATVKDYYPGVLRWFEWTNPHAWAFLLAFPGPEDLSGATKKRLYGFLRRHRINLTHQWQERVEKRKDVLRWPSDAASCAARSRLATSLARQLQVLEKSLKEYRAEIEGLFREHPDAPIFASLPGAAAKLAPRLLAHFGARRDRFPNAQVLQQLSGASPVLKQSGKRRRVVFRRACQKEFRNTMHLFALNSLQTCAWARAFYDRARARGQTNALALRNLAAKWIKIIYRMWQDGKRYDEGAHLASLIRRRSPVIQQIAQGGNGLN